MKRFAHKNAPPKETALAKPLDLLKSSGQQLDPATRLSMESYFGHSFSHVRVHNSSKAADSARALNAQAYTIGPNIIFGASQYNPEAVHGKQLLAHELTHVLQQGKISTMGLRRLAIGPADGALEKEADHHAIQAGKELAFKANQDNLQIGVDQQSAKIPIPKTPIQASQVSTAFPQTILLQRQSGSTCQQSPRNTGTRIYIVYRFNPENNEHYLEHISLTVTNSYEENMSKKLVKVDKVTKITVMKKTLDLHTGISGLEERTTQEYDTWTSVYELNQVRDPEGYPEPVTVPKLIATRYGEADPDCAINGTEDSLKAMQNLERRIRMYITSNPAGANLITDDTALNEILDATGVMATLSGAALTYVGAAAAATVATYVGAGVLIVNYTDKTIRQENVGRIGLILYSEG